MGRDLAWKRRAGEMAVVVTSILLAFGIDAAWEARGERADERAALEALLQEMTSNRDALERIISVHDSASARVGAWLRTSPEGIAELLDDDALVRPPLRLHNALWAPYTYDPNVGAVRAFVNREGSSSELTEGLRRSTGEWDAKLADTRELGGVLWESSRDVLALLSYHVVDLAPAEGQGPSVRVIERDYATRMARARADEKLVAATIAKSSLQRIYASDLGRLLDMTNALIATLERELA